MFNALIRWLLASVLDSLNSLERAIAMNQTELLEHLNTLNAAVGKVGEETTALIAEVQALKDAIAAGGTVSPEVEAALAAVEARVKAVDDLVPDAVPPGE
jgi:ABC-type transporter Mla subunit MlaD